LRNRSGDLTLWCETRKLKRGIMDWRSSIPGEPEALHEQTDSPSPLSEIKHID
jgi:hypothetical protein